MIRTIEALNFRCLRYVQQPLSDFQVLVGPNASGKTTFLDVPAFLGDLLSLGLKGAIGARVTDIRDLFFYHEGDRFQLAVELEIPAERAARLRAESGYRYVRYEISIGMDKGTGEYQIFDEQVILQSDASRRIGEVERTLFPHPPEPPLTLMNERPVRKGKKRTLRKKFDGNDNFYSEVESKKGRGGWAPSFRLGPGKSALANMPEDEQNFPVSTWLREVLKNGTQKLMLNSLSLRQSSLPGQGRLFKADGSNLPWVIENLHVANKRKLKDWLNHVRTALPDIEDVLTHEIPDTRSLYLQIVYRGGLKVPSWMASDGTLRLLALTLPAYLPDFQGIYLIEEPENGIHPVAMETVFQALRSVYSAQIILATHSPVILGCAEAKDILCFKKDATGATDIVGGSEHPALRAWKGKLNLSDLYASGVLG